MTSELDNQTFIDQQDCGHDDDRISNSYNDGSDTNSVTSAKEREDTREKEGVLVHRFGWFSIRPNFLQTLNNSIGMLVILSAYTFAVSMTVLGLVFVAITTIERRFNLTSLKSGLIASTYDLSSIVFMLFVTYFGERSNKPVWVGVGCIIFGFGSFTFSLPHFTTGLYIYGSTSAEICDVNGTIPNSCETEQDENLSKYFGVFMLAQCLHGIGATPLYTLGQAYIDENVKTKRLPLYIAIFQGVSSISPALGFVFGGLFLSLYTDVRVDQSELEIDPNSPVWVGGWWMGFLFTGSVCLLVSAWIIGLPSELPGYNEIAKARVSEAQKGSEFIVRPGFGKSLSDFPKAAWTLLKNPPFMFLNGGLTTQWFILSALAAFGPKFLESQFNLSAGMAALYAGVIIVPSTLIGCAAGAWFIMKFELDFKGQVKFCFICLLVSFFAMFVFVANCSNVSFAGVTVPYNDTPGNSLEDVNITSECNVGCNCEQMFDPVCGEDNIMYYSACHAGCGQKSGDHVDMIYTQCSCLSDEGSQAVIGRCEESCSLLAVYLIVLFIMLLFGFFTLVPAVTLTFRVVDFSQRAFAMGLQLLFVKLLGSVPGPIVFGALIDQTCLIWEYDCDGAGTCWMYDNKQFAYYTLILVVSGRLLSLFCYAGSYLTHKPIVDDEGNPLTNDVTDKDNGGIVMKTVDAGNNTVTFPHDTKTNNFSETEDRGEKQIPVTEL